MVKGKVKLIDLKPQFIRCSVEAGPNSFAHVVNSEGEVHWNNSDVDVHTIVSNIAEADGIRFFCPRCFTRNKGSEDTHRVLIYFMNRGAPLHLGVDSDGRTIRWEIRGNDFFDLSLLSSIWFRRGCGWHGIVEHGYARDA